METRISTLKERFLKNPKRHPNTSWSIIEEKLRSQATLLKSVSQMEETGGEPDVMEFPDGNLYFVDCSQETPKGRRSGCYDLEALEGRKKFPPEFDVVSQSQLFGGTLLNEEEYFFIQCIESFDLKTSSWILTPEGIRKKGGALFGDCRYGRTFIYHNGADSYYASRAYRMKVKI